MRYRRHVTSPAISFILTMAVLQAIAKGLITIILLIAASSCAGGCQAGAKSQYTGAFQGNVSITFKTNPDGTHEINVQSDSSQNSTNQSASTAPKDAKELSTTTAGPTGTAAGSAGTYEPIAPGALAILGPKLVIIGALVFIAGLICVFYIKFPGSTGMGVGLIAFGGGLIAMPWIMEKIAGPVAWGFLILLGVLAVGAIVWGIASYKRLRDVKRHGNERATRLALSGRPLEARGAIDMANAVTAPPAAPPTPTAATLAAITPLSPSPESGKISE